MVSESISFVLADSDEQVCRCLNIADLATRFNICFPVPSKGPDDVLSVLEMVWISWAGSMNHLVSDMGGEFEGELGEFMEAHGIRQYFTASEDPWQTGLLNAMAESGRRLPGRQSKMSGLEVSWKCEDSPPERTGQRTPASTRLDTHLLNESCVEDTSCRGRF